MAVEVTGGGSDLSRFRTGLYSLDWALGFRGNFGMPYRSLIEIYGKEHTGKSTLGYFLGAVLDSEREFWLADLERTGDKDYIRAIMEANGFNSRVHIADFTKEYKGENVMRTDGEMIDEVIRSLLDPKVGTIMVDSIGMFTTILASKKKIDENAMSGPKRAQVVGDFSARILNYLGGVEDPKLAIFINHYHYAIGGRGHRTPGGRKMKHAANVRMWMYRKKSDVPDGSGNFLAEIRIEKLKQGGTNKERKGLVFIIPGSGVSRTISAVYDCIETGLAEQVSGGWVKLDGKNMGRMSELIEQSGDDEVFEPFYRKLQEYEENELRVIV